MRGALIGILVSTLGSVAYGYAASILSTTLAQPSFIAKFDLATRPDAGTLIPCAVTFFFLGGLVGALSLSYLADKFGRRGMMFIACVLTITTVGIECASQNMAMFIAFRTLSGIGLGMFWSLVPIFISNLAWRKSECAPPKYRGTLTNFNGVGLAVGYTIASWANEGFSKLDASWAWIIPLLIQAVFPLLLLPCLFLMPESPRWLITHGRHEKAKQTLVTIHGSKTGITPFVQAEYDLLVRQDALDKQCPVTWSIIWSQKSYRKRAMICIVTGFQYNALATLVIGQYFPTLLEGLGVAPSNQLLISAGWVTISLPGNLVSLFLIEYLGRRKSLLIGYTAVILMLIAETITLAVGTHVKAGQALGILWLFLELFLFGSFIDGATFTLCSEIWPNRMRAKGMSLAMTSYFCSALLFAGSSFPAFENIGYKFYIVFIVPSSVITVLVYFYWPETKGVPLEQLARIFGDAIVEEDLTLEQLAVEKAQTSHLEEALKEA